MKHLSLKRFILWFFLLPLVAGGLCWKFITPPSDAPVFPRGNLTIQRADGHTFPFAIEIATTPDQVQYGLMHRHSLPANYGMLFLFDSEEDVTFWMKDTPIPLDMLFVRSDGTIAKIITNAEPFSPAPLPAEEPVRAVFEMAAGTVDRLGLKTGDKLLYPAFSGQ